MITLIVILWIVIQMQAPLWVYALVIFGLVINILDLILKMIDKHDEKILKEQYETLRKEQKRIERSVNSDGEKN